MFKNTKAIRFFIALASIVIVGVSVWSIYMFYNRIKEDERKQMQTLSMSIAALNSVDVKNQNSSVQTEFFDLALLVQRSNVNIPGIIVNENNKIVIANNIPPKIEKDSIRLYKYLENIKGVNEPIHIESANQTLYYGNSQMLNNIKYYPLILLFIIVLFISLLIFFYATSKESEKNKLWAGMAKETAHQIGTPLSSLVGWLEILRAEGKVDEDYISEIEKDIDRLKTITERFSKVGSNIKLEQTDIVQATKETYEYLKNRSSKLIDFNLDIPNEPSMVMLNSALFSWTIENLTKNAIDAMKGKGKLSLELVRSGPWIRILIKDNGKGIPVQNFKTVFTPGYTTKKRGWGLGLSLAKRIIEDYHKGKVKVLFSEVGKGTTFEIKLKRL